MSGSRHREPPGGASRAWGRDRRSSRRFRGRSEVSSLVDGTEEHTRSAQRSDAWSGWTWASPATTPYGCCAGTAARCAGAPANAAASNRVRLSTVGRARRPTVESLTRLEAAALAGAPAGTRLEVVVKNTGPAWLPVAVFFTTRGHRVFRVASAKAADLRRFLSRHAKSNGIDADTLARLPLLAPGSSNGCRLPGVEAAALDRRVRACDRLSRQGALHQRRIKDLVRQLMPVTPLTGELTKTDLVVLEHWADPEPCWPPVGPGCWPGSPKL